MKKIFSVILCIILLTGALSGCAGKSATYTDMMKLLERMNSVTEGEGSLELLFEGSSYSENELTQTLSESDIMGISINYLTSSEKQQMQMAVDYINSNSESIELTDIIIIGNESYVNMAKILDAFLPLMEDTDGDLTDYMSEYLAAVMDGNEYLYTDNSDTSESEESDVQLTDLLNGLYEALYKPMAEMDVVTFGDNVYTVTLEGENLRDIFTSVLTEIRDNADIYAGIISDILANFDTSSLGLSVPAGSGLSDDIVSSIDDLIGEINDQDVSGLKIIGTLSYDEASNTYTQIIDFLEDGQSSLKYTSKVVEKEISEITAPDMYLTYDELEKNIEDASNSLYESYSADDDGTIVYRTEETDTLQSFVNRDLSDYANLEPYDLTAMTDTVYSVPLFMIDSIETYEDSIITESPGMYQYLMPYRLSNKDTLKSFLNWYVQDDYDYYYYDDPSYSKMLVSSDESMAVMSFTYEDVDYGKITTIHVAEIAENGKDILMMDIDIYHDFMEDIDYTILSELSDLIGVSLSDFYGLDFSTM